MTEPRDIFTARSAKATSWSYLTAECRPHMLVNDVLRCGGQERFVGLEGPRDGDEGWALTPAEARELAMALELEADKVERSNDR